MTPGPSKSPSPQPLSPQAGRGAKKVAQSRQLRKDMTDAELKIWLALRDRRLMGAKFVRQDPVDKYIVDFLCRGAKLIIEIDGGQHDDNRLKDDKRSARLNVLGYRVIRFWNNEVLANQEGVLLTILKELDIDPTAPSPRESGERAGGEGSLPTDKTSC